mmetsp:Transcript_4786/g.11350  ORF Transcript_4786/g.11350 Transcript_4786/m.11350 type:complete len:1865 (-) Transcript_4786:396-5990(-)
MEDSKNGKQKNTDVTTLGARSLQDTYKSIRLFYTSVGDDIGQTYVVHGDSILLDVLSHPLLDWGYGGQVLQFFYQAELALKAFSHRGRVFKLVFFDCFEGLWVDPSAQLLRKMLMNHVKKDGKIVVESFPNWECDEWQRFMSFTRPSFALLVNPGSAELAVENINKKFQHPMRDPCDMLRKMVLDLSSKQNLECVSMTEATFKSNSMFGFTFKLPLKTQKEAASAKYPLGDFKSFEKKKPTFDLALAKKLAGTKYDSPFDSMAPTMYVLIKLLQQKGDAFTVSLAKSFLLHTVACRCLPLEARAQSLFTEGPPGELMQFLNDLYSVAVEHFSEESSKLLGWEGLALCDFVDGRLFQKIAILTSQSQMSDLEELGLPDGTESLVDGMWGIIVGQSGAKGSLLPIWAKPAFTDFDAFAKEQISAADSLLREAGNVFTGESAAEANAEAAASEKEAKEKKADDEEVADTWDDGDDDGDVADDWDAEEEEGGGEGETKAEDVNVQAEEDGGAKTLSKLKGLQTLFDKKILASDPAQLSKLAGSKIIASFIPDVEEVMVSRNTLTKKLPDSRSKQDKVWHDYKEINDGTNPPPEDRKKKENLKAKAKEEEQKSKLGERAMKIAEKRKKVLEKKRETRKKMQYITYMEKYAKSLKGGGIVYRDVVVAQRSDDKSDKKKNKNRSGKGKRGGGKKGKGKGSMRDTIREGVERKQREEAREKVDRFIMTAQAFKGMERRIAELDKNLKSMSEPYAVVPGLMKLLEWCTEAWKQEKAGVTESKGHAMETAVRLFQTVMDIFRRYQKDITVDQFKILKFTLLGMGFPDSAELLVKEFLKCRPEKLSEADLDVERPKSKELNVGLSSYRFQLLYAGHLMVRNVDSAPDERVNGFYPDKWQRDLLDVVDKKESALVVAPTSSGKTFVSYYAMKQALFDNKTIKRSTDRSIIVYVSPTRALVNQVAADVYARYGEVFGVYTKKYSRKLKECEVLITIPECLETLLLSPSSEMWTRCIKYVIFDEVHSLSNTENGDVWERIISMVRCPFIALSATLGNPEEFSSWMGRVQSTHKRKINLIIHRTRWADLSKYMYVPKSLRSFSAVQRQERIHSFQYVHPCSALGAELARTGFPPDLNFAPKDCMLLYDAMQKIKLPEQEKKRIEDLHPEIFFKNLLYIKKSDVQKYEKILKDELYKWSSTGMKDEIVKLVSALSKGLDNGIKANEDDTKGTCYSVDYLKERFVSFTIDLLNENYLPAVVFNLDRQICEDLVATMLFTLEDMEEKALAVDDKTARKQTKDKTKQLKKEKRDRDKKKRNKDEDALPGEEEEGGGVVEEETLYNVDSRFSFIEDGKAMESGEMEWWLDRLLWKTKWPRTHLLIRALQRGIGVHHDELERAYKDLVETLFRTGHLKVVVATSTLALGVNMPARTSVFCGDSPNLNPLRYRQMAGRAGRRGYDDIGNVVFIGVPPKKVFRLMSSSLLSLHGHFPMTPTVALRAVNYYGKVEKKDDSVKTLINLLKEPFFPNRETISHQAKLHFRFSMQYLLEQKMIAFDKAYDLQVRGAGAIGVHLKSAQPGNMVFAALWDAGVFQEICKTFQNKGEQIKIANKLLLVLSHIFFREPLPVGFKKEDLEGVDPRSLVCLPKLPAKWQNIIDTQRKSAIKVYTGCIQHTALPSTEGGDAKDTEAMPLTGITIGNGNYQAKGLLGRLAASRLPALARSKFFRMSGHGDDFCSATELCSSVRQEVAVDLDALPVCEMKDRQMRDMPLNAYALDFFKHSSLDLLKKENGLSSSKTWKLLRKWTYLLKDIAQAVEELQRPTAKAQAEAEYWGTEVQIERNDIVKAFAMLNTQFMELFDNWIKNMTNERKKLEERKKVELS